MEKDFNVEIKVRNGRLLSSIRKKFGTIAEMSRKTGIPATRISALVTMKAAPIGNTGITSVTALDVASALGVYFEDIWPTHMERLKRKKASFEIDMDAQEVAKLSTDNIEKLIEYKSTIELLKPCLTEREAKVVDMRFNSGMSHKQIADEMGLSCSRIHQMEAKSIRKMRQVAGRKNIDETILHEAYDD